ncbi:hypothetical protein SETIT_5G045800v2 [Setaria italica]|uniref:Uncharacterized protein n=1 Tax=Setaria italica TaxID=4555 RepID=A0A368R171_SETIT|nr:hypothetical protein SETIT_5G045800v2 [Setaria italica]
MDLGWDLSVHRQRLGWHRQMYSQLMSNPL